MMLKLLRSYFLTHPFAPPISWLKFACYGPAPYTQNLLLESINSLGSLTYQSLYHPGQLYFMQTENIASLEVILS